MEEHVNLIAKRTGERSEVIGNALKSIYQKTAVEHLNELSLIWNDIDDESKLKMAKDLSGNYNITRFITLMNGLSDSK